MINFIRNKPAILIILMSSLVILGTVFATYATWKETHSCDKVIFLEGELGRDINYVEYLGQGNVARIHYCDGKIEEMPTSRIVKVVIK
jgi:hypothetical protein